MPEKRTQTGLCWTSWRRGDGYCHIPSGLHTAGWARRRLNPAQVHFNEDQGEPYRTSRNYLRLLLSPLFARFINLGSNPVVTNTKVHLLKL